MKYGGTMAVTDLWCKIFPRLMASKHNLAKNGFPVYLHLKSQVWTSDIDLYQELYEPKLKKNYITSSVTK